MRQAPSRWWGDIGHPVAATDAKRAVIEIASFAGLGVLIVFLCGAVLTRLSVRMSRDLHVARDAEPPAADKPYGAFTGNTTVTAPPAPPKHRRESKSGVLRRAPSH